MKIFKIFLIIISIGLILIALAYPIAVYTDAPFIKKWRSIYIETAMTTFTHQWLATLFMPSFVIDEVMYNNYIEQERQINLATNWDNVEPITNQEIAPTPDVIYVTDVNSDITSSSVSENIIITDNEKDFYKVYWELDNDDFRDFLDDNPDFLEDGYENIFIDNSSYKYNIKSCDGERIYLLDCKNNIIIFEIKGDGFVGKLVTIKDSSQVDLVKSKSLKSHGTTLSEFYNIYKPVIAMNCSGFGDYNGYGNGGHVIGSLVIDGEEFGNPNSDYFLFGQKYNNKFYIQSYDKNDISEFRWAAQFHPALIVNGEQVVSGSYGYGIQPRAAIGQSSTGEMLLLVIDGRQVGYSIGATVSDCAEIMAKHNAYQAVNLDGGSSALIWYKGKNITKPSSTNNLGRYLPDCLIVRPADD